MERVKRILIIIFPLFILGNGSTAFSFTGSWEWAKNISSNAEVHASALAVDKSGNSYITGSFSDTLTIGKHHLHSSGFYDIFIARINAKGDITWLKQAGGSESDEAYGIAVDRDGNVYITGYISGNADFSGVTVKSQGARDFFLAKYDNDGNLKWVRKQEGNNEDYGKSVCVDRKGNVIVTGVFNGTLNIQGKEYKSTGRLNIFVYKYTGSGDFCWGHIGKGEGTNQVAEVNVDPSGNVYIAGTFEGMAEFDKHFITSLDTKDVFLAKYNPDGIIEWLRSGGSAVGDDQLNAIAVDSAGDIVIAGSFSGTAFFNKKELVSKGSDDIFVVKYDKDGNVIWAAQSGGKGNEHSRSLEVAKNGNIYVAGEFNYSFTFNQSNIRNTGDWDVFVLEFSSDGKMMGGTQAGGLGYDKANGIAVDDSGNIYLLGYFIQQISFGNLQLSTPNQSGCAFLAKLNGISK